MNLEDAFKRHDAIGEAAGLDTAAEWYAAHGLRVVPLKKNKHPQLNWSELHDLEPAECLARFRQHRPAKIGVLTGYLFDVIDVDDDQALQDLIDRFGAMPKWLGLSRTPSGGYHYYLPPQQREAPNKVNLLGTDRAHGGVDYRGRGGMAVVPPSPGYRWQSPLDLAADVPAGEWRALVDGLFTGYEARLAARRAEKAAQRPQPAPAATGPSGVSVGPHPWVEALLRGCVAEVADAVEGTRNSTLNNSALRVGHFVPRFLDQGRVEELLLDAAAAAGLGAAEARATIASGLRAGMAEPNDPPASTVQPPREDAALQLAGLHPAADDVSGRGYVWRTPSHDATPAEVLPEVTPAPQSPTAAPVDQAEALQRLFEHDVALEAGRIRVREEARRRVAAERREAAEPFDHGTLAEILARPPEPPMRIDQLMPWESAALAVAMRKTGKTTLTANLSRCLLTGEDFLDAYGVRPLDGDLAMLNFEVSGAQLARWFHDAQVPAERCHIVNLRGRRNPLANEEDRGQLAELLRSRGVEALIVDPFGRAYTGSSQNDAGEVGAWLSDLDRFTRGEVGARDLLLTAHAGWNGERTRGSTALEDWADVIWTMTRDDGDDPKRYFRAEGRDVDVPEDQLHFDPASRRLALTGHGSRKASRAEKRLDDLGDLALDIVASSPGLNGVQIEQALRDRGASFQKGDHSKALRQLVSEGQLVVETGKRGAKNYYLPRPTPTHPDGVTSDLPHLPLIGRGRSGGVAEQRRTPETELPTEPAGVAS